MRSAVDLCHRDGTLKREVAANPSKYIHDVRGGPLPWLWLVCNSWEQWSSDADTITQLTRTHTNTRTHKHTQASRSPPGPPQDPHLVPMLRMYKRSGRKLFLATNSLWDYTHVVMNYLIRCGGGSEWDLCAHALTLAPTHTDTHLHT